MAARPRAHRARGAPTPEAATEAWFLRRGLPYFVPAERARARQALRPGRTWPLLAATVLGAATAGAALALVFDQVSAAPATLFAIGLLAGLGYALTALRARRIVTWAGARTLGSLRLIFPVVTRALPLLLLFVTFLFINAEVWQLAGGLRPGVLWLTVLLLAAMAVAFLMARLPEEVDRLDDRIDDRFLVSACRGTPLAQTARELVADPQVRPASYAPVSGFERWNLILVLLVIQLAQVLLLVVSVLVFFLFFGSLTMRETVQLSWTAKDDLSNMPYLSNISVELFQVSLFLGAFSGLYFTVSAVTDDAYRGQFFTGVMDEMERAVGVRAVYLALRARERARAAHPGERTLVEYDPERDPDPEHHPGPEPDQAEPDQAEPDQAEADRGSGRE